MTVLSRSGFVQGYKGVQVKTGADTGRLVEAVSLVICLAIAVWVFCSGASMYQARLEFSRKSLIYLTVIYFVFGTFWLRLKEKTGGGSC